MGVCNCSMFCCTLLYVHFSIAIILMGKRELIALLNLSSWCLVMVERLFLTVPRGCLQFVIVVFPDHTHLLFLMEPTMRTFFFCCCCCFFFLFMRGEGGNNPMPLCWPKFECWLCSFVLFQEIQTSIAKNSIIL